METTLLLLLLGFAFVYKLCLPFVAIIVFLLWIGCRLLDAMWQKKVHSLCIVQRPNTCLHKWPAVYLFQRTSNTVTTRRLLEQSFHLGSSSLTKKPWAKRNETQSIWKTERRRRERAIKAGSIFRHLTWEMRWCSTLPNHGLGNASRRRRNSSSLAISNFKVFLVHFQLVHF